MILCHIILPSLQPQGRSVIINSYFSSNFNGFFGHFFYYLGFNQIPTYPSCGRSSCIVVLSIMVYVECPNLQGVSYRPRYVWEITCVWHRNVALVKGCCQQLIASVGCVFFSFSGCKCLRVAKAIYKAFFKIFFSPFWAYAVGFNNYNSN